MSDLKEGKGAAFWNNHKTKAIHPDLSGNAMINGKEYSIGVWISKTQGDGTLYLHFSFTERIRIKEDDGPIRNY